MRTIDTIESLSEGREHAYKCDISAVYTHTHTHMRQKCANSKQKKQRSQKRENPCENLFYSEKNKTIFSLFFSPPFISLSCIKIIYNIYIYLKVVLTWEMHHRLFALGVERNENSYSCNKKYSIRLVLLWVTWIPKVEEMARIDTNSINAILKNLASPPTTRDIRFPIVFRREYDVSFFGCECYHPFDTRKWGKVACIVKTSLDEMQGLKVLFKLS